MIYIIENTDKLGEDFLAAALPKLSLQRLQRIDSLKILSDKINSAVVYLLLRYALKKEYGITDAPELTYGNHEKPYLKDYPDIFFNFSHCRNACTCIVSNQETAADIADIRKISPRTASYFCSPEELQQAALADNRDVFLNHLWSMKECFSKLDGSGLYMNYKSIDTKEYAKLLTIEKERYCAAYYADKATEIQYLSTDELFAK